MATSESKPEVEFFDASGAKVERHGVKVTTWADGRQESSGLLPGDEMRIGDYVIHREPNA